MSKMAANTEREQQHTAAAGCEGEADSGGGEGDTREVLLVDPALYSGAGPTISQLAGCCCCCPSSSLSLAEEERERVGLYSTAEGVAPSAFREEEEDPEEGPTAEGLSAEEEHDDPDETEVRERGGGEVVPVVRGEIG